MKLDLIAIRKISPARQKNFLWDLAQLGALISTLVAVIRCGVCDGVTVRLSQRMLVQYRRELRERILDNFNMRVKAWVLQCPERIAYVRGVIGEAAIKRWRKNRLLDHAFTRTFGNWRARFPNGVMGRERPPKRGYTHRTKYQSRTYIWKPFALVKIVNAERILFGQATAKPASDADAETKEIRAAYIKLWDVDITGTFDNRKNTQARQPRAIQPVQFTPAELVSDAATGIVQERVDEADTLKLHGGQQDIFPPPEASSNLDTVPDDPTEDKPP